MKDAHHKRDGTGYPLYARPYRDGDRARLKREAEQEISAAESIADEDEDFEWDRKLARTLLR